MCIQVVQARKNASVICLAKAKAPSYGGATPALLFRRAHVGTNIRDKLEPFYLLLIYFAQIPNGTTFVMDDAASILYPDTERYTIPCE